MNADVMMGLVAVVSCGVLAQWVAWKTKLPSILLLLITGIIAGPIGFGIVIPKELLGDTFFPIVSLSVSIILFEGGLSLRFSELKGISDIVRNLITIGVLITWTLASLASIWVLDLSIGISILFGAIMIVTGPTVIVPLLRQVRPSGQAGKILKWEGIVNDPIGAMFAVIVFEVLIAGGLTSSVNVALLGVGKTVVFGTGIGVGGGLVIMYMLKKHLLPEFLVNPITLGVVIVVFEAANLIQAESGLWSVTVMGIFLANQKSVKVKHIVDFKENLRVILISTLFILLASQLTMADLSYVNWKTIGFLMLMIVVVRPLSVFMSTIGSKLTIREKVFLSSMAPRGIVAAAVSSLFAIRLESEGYIDANLLIPYAFILIIGTVAIYGLAGAPLARLLGLAKPVPYGTLILGAHRWGIELGAAIKKLGFKVVLADTNVMNIDRAKREGLNVYHGNILAEYALDEMNLDGIGHLLALTPNDEVNALSCIKFSGIFGNSEVYQMPKSLEGPEEGAKNEQESLGGEMLFGKEISYSRMEQLFREGASFVNITLGDEVTMSKLRADEGYLYYPVFFVTENDQVRLLSAEDKIEEQEIGDMIALKVPARLKQTIENAA